MLLFKLASQSSYDKRSQWLGITLTLHNPGKHESMGKCCAIANTTGWPCSRARHTSDSAPSVTDCNSIATSMHF